MAREYGLNRAESMFEEPRLRLLALRLTEGSGVVLRPDGERVARDLRRLYRVDTAPPGKRAEGRTEILWRDLPEAGGLRSSLDAPHGDVPLVHRRPEPRDEHEIAVLPSTRALLAAEL